MQEQHLSMFNPAEEEASERLLDVFLSIFLRAGSGQALLGEYAFDLEKYNIPDFTDQLTLRLAVKIKTQDDSGGTYEFSPSKQCLIANQLKEHIKSTGTWGKLVSFPFPRTRHIWEWQPRPFPGAFELYQDHQEDYLCWRKDRVSTSRPRSQAVRVRVA